ncbi:hypothetical protein DFQ15_11761 [Xylophilus ampelinus]|uniref:Uncharacterized protein n=2 Tax=Xylophilus ampelinus TaxID=54067 RepID=A0A318SFK8_9BURK|nr:hypothetical protein DFQ15_11761 [Xylophilus ampelinus]
MDRSITPSSDQAGPSKMVGCRLAITAFCMVAAGAMSAGCAFFQPQTAEQSVAQRAQERWDLMMANKFEQSYEYTAPSYRALKEYKAYRLGYGPSSAWTGAKVVKVTCSSEENCNAVLEVSVKNLTPIRSTANLATALDETWVREGGRWYVLPAL